MPPRPTADNPLAGSSSRPGCPERLSQNRTSAVHIRLFGTAGYDPGSRPDYDLAVARCRLRDRGATREGLSSRQWPRSENSPCSAQYALRSVWSTAGL
jgi:hypothetical protein